MTFDMVNKMHRLDSKRTLLILLITGSILVIIIFWQQTGGKPTITIPHMVLHAVRRVYDPSDERIEPQWTWKCINKRCERRHYSGDDDRPTSQATCGMLCGSTQLWPQPTGAILLGTKSVTFLHQHLHFETDAHEPVRSLLQKSYAVFNENIAAMVRHSEYWLQKSDIDRIVVQVSVANSKQEYLLLDTDESYNITIKSGTGVSSNGDGSTIENQVLVMIRASTYFGARHGLETLSQLIWWDEFATSNGGMLRTLKTAKIRDKPVFSYRGLMLDTARNFIPIEYIKRVLDGMAASKLNVFHWHISDSQSFPLKLPSVPQLAIYGAYSSNMVYEAEEVLELVEYARIRGIRIIIEVDVPAHAGNGWQWGPKHGLDNLALCVNERPWSLYCGEPPCGQLNPENPHVYDLLEKIYGDLIDLGTDPEIYHLGGDEVNLDCWAQKLLPRKTSSAALYNYTDLHDLWGEFTLKAINRLERVHNDQSRLNARIKKYNDKLSKMNIIFWSSNLSKRPYLQKYLDKDKVIVQSWGASQWRDTQDLLADGYRVLVSHVDAWYLDCGFGRWRETGEAACDPFRTWQTMYTHRPWVMLHEQMEKVQQPGSTSPVVNVKKQIIGGEACLWSEQLEATSLDTRLWPRTAAFAERLWTDPSPPLNQDNIGSYIDVSVPEDVYTRLSTQRERLIVRGIGAEAMWPRWCSQNPGMCL